MAKALKRVLLAGAGGLVAILALVLIASVAIGYGSAHGAIDRDMGVPIVMGVSALLLMVGAFWLGVFWMRVIDEAAREAHKWAWYWGGTAGMAVGGVFMLLSAIPREAPIPFPLLMSDTPDPAGYAASGAFILMMLMTLGYSIAWAVWWLRHR